MAKYRFVVNGDFVEFYDGSQHVFTVRNTTQDVDWYYETAPGINFEVDGHKYFTVPSQIEIDGVTLSANTEFDAAIVAIFPNLAGGGEGGGITTVGNVGAGDAKGASISGSTIFMHKATETQPGLVGVDGTTQSFGGPKSWAGTQQFQNLVTFESIAKVKEISAPSAPAAGYISVYAKTDKKLYYKDSDNLETGIGTNLYSADGALSGNRVVTLGVNSLSFIGEAGSALVWTADNHTINGAGIWSTGDQSLSLGDQSGLKALIDLAPAAGKIELNTHNATGGGNISFLNLESPPDGASTRFYIYANFDDGSKTARIDGFADATISTFTHNADTHNFATGDIIITTLAGGGTTGLSIDNDGKIIRTP